MDKTKTPVYLCKSWYDGESDTVRDCTCGTCEKAIKKAKPSQKQQFIEKCLKKILTSKFIIALALELPTEVYDDFIKKIAKVIHLQLSECWDMAGAELEPKLTKLLLPEAISDSNERNKTFAFGYNSASKEVNKKIRTLIDSLTSQKEGKVIDHICSWCERSESRHDSNYCYKCKTDILTSQKEGKGK